MKKMLYNIILPITNVMLITYMITPITSLEIKQTSIEENGMKEIAEKYLSKISNIESKYIIDETMSKIISNLLKGKVNAFPLYKVSLSIDPKAVKIPWTLEQGSSLDGSNFKKKYKYYKLKNTNKNTPI